MVLGGDYCSFGPWPAETLERLQGLENATWLRGNGERWLVDPPLDMPTEQSQFIFAALASTIAALPDGAVDKLVGLPTLAERPEAFYCHGSPLSDVESSRRARRRRAPARRGEGAAGRLRPRHLQFRRPGPDATELVDPGSVGMPLDGDTRAAWATRGEDGEVEFRRTASDVARRPRRCASTTGAIVSPSGS